MLNDDLFSAGHHQNVLGIHQGILEEILPVYVVPATVTAAAKSNDIRLHTFWLQCLDSILLLPAMKRMLPARVVCPGVVTSNRCPYHTGLLSAPMSPRHSHRQNQGTVAAAPSACSSLQTWAPRVCQNHLCHLCPCDPYMHNRAGRFCGGKGVFLSTDGNMLVLGADLHCGG